MNIGKQFEQMIKASVPETCLFYRLPDPASSFGAGSQTRFSTKNPFDCILWDPGSRILYALELKTVAGKSISFERTKDDKGSIHKHQIDALTEWGAYDGVTAGLIIEFRELETTVFLHIDGLRSVMAQVDKKSFSLHDLQALGIPYQQIGQTKKRTKYHYDIQGWLDTQ